jgi:hypothetical protein
VIDTNITVILHVEDMDRLLKLLYHGTRPPLVRIFVCGCGRSVNLTRQDAQTFGWQLLPHVECPWCLAKVPYEGAEARERFLKLVDVLCAEKKDVR